MLIPFCASGWKQCNRNWPIGRSLGTCFVKHVHKSYFFQYDDDDDDDDDIR